MNDHLSSCVLNNDYSKLGGSPILVIEDDPELAEDPRAERRGAARTG